MVKIRAFVGHSFAVEDEPVVRAFLTYFDQMKGALPDFDWVHAKAAQPTELAAKVLKLIEGRNVFIGICTNRERVVADQKLRSSWLNNETRYVGNADLDWKTSDWIIQEIGLAVGRGMSIVLLIENGCRKPGGLQGDVEFLTFDRSAPERAFGLVLEMMKALSPLAGTGEGTSPENTQDSPGDEIQPPASSDDDTPDESWDREKYENAFLWRLFTEKPEEANRIDAAYRASQDATNPEVLAAWDSMTEVWRIRMGVGGSIDNLRRSRTQFSSNAEIAINLASGMAVLGMHSEAAAEYLGASELAVDNVVEKQRLRGLAGIQFAKAGDGAAAEQIFMDQRRSYNSANKSEQLNYLYRMKEYTADSDDKYIGIEVLERIIQLAPEDWNSRFSLAYRHSEVGNDDLSLYHYLKIPVAQRSSMAWNNLGVCFQQLAMPGKSVEAYRQASSKDETLAMSNLAYKFMKEGFIEEANDQLQKALKIEDFHRNVGEAISKLKDIPEDEDKKLTEALKKAEEKRKFFGLLGEAITYPDVQDLPAAWAGPDYNLTIAISGNEFAASGEYERTTSGLSGLLGSGQKTVRYKVSYKGKLFGRRVIGAFTKKSEGEAATPNWLGLGSGDDETEFAMLIDTDKATILVAERPSSASPKFYTLRPQKGL